MSHCTIASTLTFQFMGSRRPFFRSPQKAYNANEGCDNGLEGNGATWIEATQSAQTDPGVADPCEACDLVINRREVIDRELVDVGVTAGACEYLHEVDRSFKPVL